MLDCSINITILKPKSEYPEGIFKHHDALFYSSPDIVFIATQPYVEDDIDEDDDNKVYSEVSIWTPPEIRLLGTLTLSVPENGGWVCYIPYLYHLTKHPLGKYPELPTIPSTVDLSLDSSITSCLSYINALLKEIEDVKPLVYTMRTQKSLPRSNPEIEKRIFENIDITNSLLLRGIYHLIKGPMLVESYFMEDAFINLQISFESAINIIKDRLFYEGNKHPNKNDVFNYLESKLGYPNPVDNIEYSDFLKEMLSKWIDTKHPNYGWAPSLFAEDIYDTYRFLISIYRHIVLDELIGSSYYDIHHFI